MLLGYGKIDGKRVLGELAVRVGTSNLLPQEVSTKGTFADGGGFGAGGRVGLGDQAGTYGWGGAAGTVAFVDMKHGLRANMMTQYMPSEAYPMHSEFPAAVLADLAAMAGGAKKAA
jgi:CubicO group peptidase (beta-lactamase class C family)